MTDHLCSNQNPGVPAPQFVGTSKTANCWLKTEHQGKGGKLILLSFYPPLPFSSISSIAPLRSLIF